MKTEDIKKKIREEIRRAVEIKLKFEEADNWKFVALFDGYIYALGYVLDLLKNEN